MERGSPNSGTWAALGGVLLAGGVAVWLAILGTTIAAAVFGSFLIVGGGLIFLSLFKGLPFKSLQVRDDGPTPVVIHDPDALSRAKAAQELGEAQRRRNILNALWREYLASHDGISPQMLAGTAPLPKAWVEARLEQLGEQWRLEEYRML
jgi:hypothetical protein